MASLPGVLVTSSATASGSRCRVASTVLLLAWSTARYCLLLSVHIAISVTSISTVCLLCLSATIAVTVAPVSCLSTISHLHVCTVSSHLVLIVGVPGSLSAVSILLLCTLGFASFILDDMIVFCNGLIN